MLHILCLILIAMAIAGIGYLIIGLFGKLCRFPADVVQIIQYIWLLLCLLSLLGYGFGGLHGGLNL